MKKIFTHLFAVLLLSLVTTSAWAQGTIENGCVYHFQNGAFAGRAITAVEGDLAAVKATDTKPNDIKQLWYAIQSGDNWIFRNLYNGRYLSQTGSSNWGLTDTNTAASNVFDYIVAGTDKNTIRSTAVSDGNGYMHLGTDTQPNVVGWSSGAGGSQWVVTKKDYTTEDIASLLATAVSTFPTVAAFQTQLNAIFEDVACTKLKSSYSEMTEEQILADENYKALSTPLRDMVLKVYNEKTGIETAWAEDNADATKHENNLDWSGLYAKKFRVQMYEPYSIAGDITGFLRMNAHANNDNPTGIYVPEGGVVYVMVEGEIKDGATLRLIDAGSNERITEATTGGYELNTGLNIIRYAEEAGMLYICYNVDTYDPNGESEDDKFPHKLSEYPPLKIHIEGGAINGFYSSCGDYLANKTYEGVTYNEDLWGGVDDDNDWIYMEERANLSVLPIISHRQILLFQLNEENGQQGMKHFLPESVSVPDTPFSYPQNGETSSWDDYDAYGMDCNITTGKINIWMETWDRIMHAELATLGLISEDDVNKMNEFYPRWKSDGTKAEIYDMTNAGPDGKTYKMFCNGRDYSEYYNHHGVSLGTTSGYMSAGWNAANYNNSTFGELMGMPTSGGLWGPVHEIGHQFQDVFNIRGATEVTNNVFSNAATWYQGISTSRYNGGNLTTTLDNFNSGLPFVDYNIWSMTQMFYKLWLYYHLAGNNTQFYPRFFEMLRVDPLNAKGATATGTESMLKIYEKMCDAAGEDLTEFFRAHGFFVLLDNYAKEDYGITVFTQTQEEVDAAIERVKSKGYKENLAVILINDGAEATLRHDGKTPRSFFDGTANPEYGGVNDFIDGSATAGGAYTAMVNSDGTMTMIGNGGIGFLVFDENGNIISFNDNSTFALSDEAKETIMTGNATIVSVGSDVNAEPVTATIDLTAMQKAILGELIAKAQAIIDKVDDTYKKIGYYKGAAVADLAAVLANAKTVYESASGYEAAYDLLYAEYQKVLANPDAKIPFDPSLTYIITNKAYTNQTMWVNSSKVVRSEGGVDQTGNAAKWQFKDAGTTGVYNIYNLSGYYCPAVEQSTSMTAIETLRPDTIDGLYTLQEMEDGVWAIKLSPAASYRNFHSSGSNVVGWETGNDASRWYLTAVEANATIADLTDLEVYITKTEALLGEVLGSVTYTRGDSIALQTTTEGDSYYIWSNAPSAAEGSINYLVDGATNNYFHTDFTSEPPSGTHYIAVDLGENNTLSRFAFSHTTRSSVKGDFPKSVDVYGSDEKNGTYKYLGSASGMPQTGGTAWQFDGMIISSHRYLRFNMHANRGYWHMAEFDIMPVTGFTATVNDTYSATVNVATVTTAMEALYNGKGVALSMSPTEETIDPVLKALETAYKALYTEYSAAITERKNTLAQLAANTQNLINQVGTVGFGSNVTKLTLTAENLYCNAPYTAQNNSDYSADYVSKLTDNSATTFLHTDYSGTIAAPHYLRVYLGENSTAKSFKFNYTTRDNGNNCPTTILIEGCNEADGAYTTITTLTAAANGLPNPGQNTSGGVAASFESSVITMGAAYKYVRFKVTGVEGGGATFFVISEFGFSTVEDVIAVNSKYKSVVTEDLLLASVHTTNSSAAMSTNALVTSVPMLDAQIADQQATYNKLYAALKANLKELIDNTQALYDKMADDEGNVNSNYSVSALKNQDLVDALAQIRAAQLVFENASATVENINTAYETLDEKYQVLLEVENANVAATKDKSTLNALIASTNTLLGTINGNIENNENYYAGANGLALDELNTALQNAQDAVSRYYLTETQYTAAYEALNDCYTAANNVVTADVANRATLTTLIANVNTLLGNIAEESAPKNVAVPLQSTTADGDFYISVASTSSGSIANLYDKNADGTAITAGDSYYGSNWGSVAAYSQYVQVDLGEGITIDKLLFDYTTRDSGHDTERPTSIKVLGSNNGTDYTEITVITEGMPVGQRAQWSLTETLELGAPYRYVRFAVDSEAHSFHMSDFNLYALIGHTRALKEYYTTAEGLELDVLCIALQSAEYAADHYLTNEQLSAVVEMLNSYYTAANTIVEADVEAGDRTDLTYLVAETEKLIEEVATVTEVVTPVLSTANVYCNADNSTNTGAGTDDKIGVAALLDGDLATHLHTTYGGNAQDDDLDHYIRVDLGDASVVTAFKFNYKGRQANSNNAPTNMTVEAGNSIEAGAEWVTLATLSELPTGTAPVSYESELIEMSEAYRYIRFMVTGTQNNSVTTYNGKSHKFFVMSEFGFTAHSTIEVKEGYTNVTKELVRAAYDEKNTATAENDYYMTESDYNAALAELQAAYNALNIGKELSSLPVKLTTDVNNPVLYKIKVKSNENVFTYDGKTDSGTKNPVLAADELGNRYQAWYFMQGGNAGSYDDVLIMPYYNNGAKNTTLKLGYANINGQTKPVASESGASSYNWYITFTSSGDHMTTEGWWNLQPENGTSDNTFVNQQGGNSSTILSFWKSANNPDDQGSQFRFVLDETDYSLSDSYYALLKQYNSYSEIEGGTAVGTYTQASVDAFNAERTEVAALLEAKNATDDEYNAAREQFIAAYEALKINMPDPAKYYVLRCNHEDRYIYVNADNKLQWAASSYDKAQSRAVWQFEEIDANSETWKMKSLHTMSYLNQLVDDQWTFDEETGKVVTIVKSPTVDGAVIFKIEGHANEGLHAHGANNSVIAHTNEAGANHYFFEEVEDVTSIKHDVTMTAKFSSVMLGYNATVPAGVKAYNAIGIDGGYVSLVKIADGDEANNVIPANTPVVLHHSVVETIQTFKYTSTEAVKPEVSVLGGSLFVKYVECDTKKDYYKLMLKNGEAKMYWMYKEFNALGQSQGDNDNGGHIKCSANKIYMALPNSGSNPVAMYGMRFVDDSATGLEEMKGESGEVKAIYDLQGRKLSEITEPGMYIVDGKKVYVK